MTTLVLEQDPVAERVEFTSERLVVHLTDGRMFGVPLTWFPRLQHATADERENWQLIGGGYAVEWPDLDEHVGVEGLLAGRRSGESERSLQRWYEARGIEWDRETSA
jgi:hypothetical protein